MMMKAIFAIAFLALISNVLGDCMQKSFCVARNGHNGRDGNNGINGNDGVNGKDGKDGKNGISGLNGRDGIDGTDGVDGKNCDGRNGTNGINGRNGTNGRDGKNGNNGINGKDGVDGKDGKDHDEKNWKECAWGHLNDNKDVGVIKNCAFKKHSSKTWLKVVVSSNMRISGCDRCCSRWYVTFDGKECSAPVPIDVAVYMAKGTGMDLHRPRIIRGHCYIPHAKTIIVELHVGKCHGGYTGADAQTGWNSSTSIFVEEVEAPQQ